MDHFCLFLTRPWLPPALLALLACCLPGCGSITSLGPAAENIGRTHVAIRRVEGFGSTEGKTCLKLSATLYKDHVVGLEGRDIRRCQLRPLSDLDEVWLVTVAGEGHLMVVPPGIPWKATPRELTSFQAMPLPEPADQLLARLGKDICARDSLDVDDQGANYLMRRPRGEDCRWVDGVIMTAGGPGRRDALPLLVETRQDWTHYAAWPLVAGGGLADLTITATYPIWGIPCWGARALFGDHGHPEAKQTE